MEKINQIVLITIIVLLLSGCTNNEMLNNSFIVNTKSTSTKIMDEKIEYYPDGQLSDVIKLQDEIEVERVSYFYDTGKFSPLKISYQNNQIVLQELYYKNGGIALSVDFLNGLEKRYYKNGNLALIIEYKNGKAFSVYKYTYEGEKTKMTNTDFYNIGLEY